MSETESEEQQLFERAVVRAGGVEKLARAMSYDMSSLYKARKSGRFSTVLVAALRVYLGSAPEPHLPSGDEEQAEADEADEADAAPVAEPPRQVAPPAPRVEAPARDEVVVRLPRHAAEQLYRQLRRDDDRSLALSLADALLGAA